HVRVLHADHGSHTIAVCGDLGAAQHAGTSAGLHPGRSAAGLACRGSHGDVATEANNVVETQLLGQHPIELLVAEAAVGDNAHLDVRRQQFGQLHQYTMLVEAAVVLERALLDCQPHQRRGTAVVGDEGHHNGGLVV